MKRPFRVVIDGSWDGEAFVLDEDFVYGDGETDERIWRITPTGEGEHIGRAGDVIGVAKGRSVGQAAELKLRAAPALRGFHHRHTLR